MDQGIINPKSLAFPKDDNNDPVAVMPTFYGDEYTDRSAYLKFNNAIKRMSEPREVEHVEADVEFVFRNETHHLYAVVFHYEDGTTDSDMLVKLKNGVWAFYRNKIRLRPSFVSAYISSIYGYKKLSEIQIAQELAKVPAIKSKMAIIENYVLSVWPGGINIARCAITEGEMTSAEMVDFVPYETLERDRIKDFYHELLSRYVSETDLNIEHLPEDVIKETLNSSLERMKKKNNK